MVWGFLLKIKFAIIFCIGVWRSLVARTAGGREVAGSNPVAPIYSYNKKNKKYTNFITLFKNPKNEVEKVNFQNIL